jgi:transcriptional regulator with XRE-family HTH domain
MTNRQLARIHAALRVRLKLRQSDVADAAGIGRSRVVKLEAAEIDRLRFEDLRRSFEALGARLDLVVSYRGAEVERLLDELHARLLGAVVRILHAAGWDARIEVSYSLRGERGSIDVLAWHSTERALLVVEVKSELPGVDPLLRPLDAKVRLAPAIARDQFGWWPATVSRIVVLPEDRTCRRQVERHASVMNAALPARSRDVRTWLRRPSGVLAGLWFLTIDPPRVTTRNPSAIRRVKRPRTCVSGQAEPADRASAFDIRLIDPHKVSRGPN